MKYYLIVGYNIFEKTKNLPIVKISINDILLDEFQCSDTDYLDVSSTITYSDVYRLYDFIDTKIHTHQKKFKATNKYKFFEIESKSWPAESKIEIEVTNNKSNYNNGFMSKRSLISISPIFLVPKFLLDDHSKMTKIMKKILYGNTLYVENKDTKPNRYSWPGLYATATYNTGPDNAPLRMRGSDFKICLPIKRKHRIFHLIKNGDHICGYPCMSYFFHAWYQFFKKENFDLLFESDCQIVKYKDTDVFKPKRCFTTKISQKKK